MSARFRRAADNGPDLAGREKLDKGELGKGCIGAPDQHRIFLPALSARSYFRKVPGK
jgi:hypothetical protein